MITASKPASTTALGASREGYFTIDPKNAAHLFGILRGQLYSDKPMAILREYCTNAQDSHAEAGYPERPIEVKLPSLLDMTLTIRDYGTGLSEDDIFQVFASYGESTKRGTNNQVGMLGLGSKSAFSYVSSFTIISRFDGERSMYEAYLDETGLGKISLMHRAPTQEENGVDIQVSVGNREDIQKFGDAAVRLFAHWNPRPVILGSGEVAQRLAEFDHRFEQNTVETGSNWTLFSPVYLNGNRSMHAVSCVMGNVCYPVDANHLNPQNQAWLKSLYTLRFHVPIGDVEPVASREGLEYSRYTIASLNRHLDAIRREIAGKLESNLQASSSLWGARCELNSMRSLVHNIGCDFKWRGQPLVLDPVKIPSSVSHVREYSSIGNEWRRTRNRNIFPNSQSMIFVDRNDVAKNSRFDRIRQNYPALNALMTYIEFPDAQSAQEWSEQEDVMGAPIVYLSDLPYKRKSSARRGSANGVEAKRLQEAFVYKHVAYAPVKSTAWDAVEVDMDNDQGVYVTLSGFMPQGLCSFGLDGLNTLHETCRTLKTLKCLPDKIYGFKKASAGKLGPGWKPLAAYVTERLLDSLDDPEILMALHHTFATHHIPQSLFTLAKSREQLPEGPMRDLVCHVASLKPVNDYAPINACHWLSYNVLGAEQPYRQKFNALCAEQTLALHETVQKRYPMLSLLETRWHGQEDNISIVLDYIRLVDGRE